LGSRRWDFADGDFADAAATASWFFCLSCRPL
jgi:hypothetical protein